MNVEWFCQVMGSEVGPLSQSELIDMVRHHKLNPEDLVRRGNSSWVPAFDVKGLFAAAAKPPKPQSGEEPKSTAAPVEKQRTPPTESKPTAQPVATGSGNRIADWYCIASGEKQGPLGLGELRSFFQDGRLRQTDRVWRSSSPKFRKAKEIEELSGENN